MIYLLADDLGYSELGCYGQKIIKTPNIDRLAKEGIRFTNHYSGNAVCAPSRCCLMTGKHPGHAYIRNNGDPKHLQHLAKKNGWEFPGQNPIPDSEVTLAEVLKQKGYATGAAGKWGLGHFGTTGDPNKQGFDLFFGFNCQRHAHNHYPEFSLVQQHEGALPRQRPGRCTAVCFRRTASRRSGLDFIRKNQDRPFFLYMPFAIPHLSIQVPESSPILAEYRRTIKEEEYTHKGYLKHPTPRAGYAGHGHSHGPRHRQDH